MEEQSAALNNVRRPLATRKKLIRILIAVLVFFGLYWVYSHSFIEITVEDGTSGNDYTYIIQSQDGGDPATIKSRSNKIKRLVAKDTYNISVVQDDRSFFSITTSSNFLRSTKVSAKMSPETARKFVGDNPGPCMYYLADRLISSRCDDLINNYFEHVPATPNNPTYTIKNTLYRTYGYLDGLIKKDSNYLVLVAVTGEEAQTSSYFLDTLSPEAKLINRTELTNLTGGKQYSIVESANGFVIHDLSFERAFYYTSPTTQPKTISLERPKEDGLGPVSADFNGENTVTLSSSTASTKSKDITSEIVLKVDGKVSHLVREGYYKSVHFCGNKKLCVLHDGTLEVNDISSGDIKLLYKLADVKTVERINDDSLVVNQKGVLNFNVENRNGYFEYSLGDYGFNNMQVMDGSSYVLSLTNNKGRKAALLITRSSPNTESIDKKIAKLQKLPEVSFVSIYDKNIYIAAELGELVYDPSTNSYTDNPQTKKVVAEKINKMIDELGIDRKAYSISSDAF